MIGKDAGINVEDVTYRSIVKSILEKMNAAAKIIA
jgi:hypothetical protein